MILFCSGSWNETPQQRLPMCTGLQDKRARAHYLGQLSCGVYFEPRWTYPGFLGKTWLDSRPNSRLEFNGTTTLVQDSFSKARFSTLGSMRVHVKGAFIASITHLYKLDGSRTSLFHSMDSYEQLGAIAHKARKVCWQNIASTIYTVYIYIANICILSIKNYAKCRIVRH